jgi:hypothetical protein
MAAKPPAKAGTPAGGQVTSKDLADRLADPAFQQDIERAVRELPPERAAELVTMLEASLRRRRLELYGYVGAALIVLLGLIGGLVIMGSGKGGTFMGWIFFIPIGLAGLVMWLVGRRARTAQQAAARASASASSASGSGSASSASGGKPRRPSS